MSELLTKFKVDNFVRLDVVEAWDDWQAVMTTMHWSRTIEWEDGEWECGDPVRPHYFEENAL